LLYRTLIAEASERGYQRLACEVNSDPPNPVSDAFHAGFGFAEIGMAELTDRDKTVRYFVRDLIL
jgi:predicted GNAT superfamily acetyltransferase